MSPRIHGNGLFSKITPHIVDNGLKLSRRRFLGAGAAAGAAAAAGCRSSDPPPDIVFILADDLGYRDLGCFGARGIETPNIDRLAAEGMRLTAHYAAAPAGSPSRAGLLRGRYPQRTGVTRPIRDGDEVSGLELNQNTLADTLSGAGYETALIGKWNLGLGYEHHPLRRGFQSFYGFLNSTIDYETHISLDGGFKGQRATYRGDTPVEEQGYLPELLHREAVQFIEKPRDQPFFLLLSLALPHPPLQVPDRWSSMYGHFTDPNRRIYAGMVSAMDHGVGRVLDAVDRSQNSKNTLVIFSSDHGWEKLGRNPELDGAGDNGSFRGGKYELTEGGIRVPGLARWPLRILPGSISGEPTIHLDWMPTLRRVAGLTREPSREPDGVDIFDLLTSDKKPAGRTLLWGFEDERLGLPASFAARQRRYKYLQVGEEKMLIDLIVDQEEETDLSSRFPNERRHIEAIVEGWRKEMRI